MWFSDSMLYKIDDMFATINYCLYDYWVEYQDPRSKHLPFIDYTPLPLILAVMAYYLVITKFMPWYMQDKEPYNLRKTMLVYNAVMAVGNLWAFTTSLEYIDYGRVFLNVDYPGDQTSTPETRKMIILGYLYLISKLLDWMDTLFLCLRKKYTHITLLHMYHHISVPVFGWLLVKVNAFIPGMRLFGLMNSFIHFVMYSYYFLAAFGPEIQKYLWWKRYITQMQLAQFIILGIYGYLFLFFQRGYPVFWLYVAAPQPLFFFYMFYDFYKKTYVENKNREMNKKVE